MAWLAACEARSAATAPARGWPSRRIRRAGAIHGRGRRRARGRNARRGRLGRGRIAASEPSGRAAPKSLCRHRDHDCGKKSFTTAANSAGVATCETRVRNSARRAALRVAAGEAPHEDRAADPGRSGCTPARNAAKAAHVPRAALGRAGSARREAPPEPGGTATASTGPPGRSSRHRRRSGESASTTFSRRIEVAVADQRNALQVRLDRRDAIPIGRAFEEILPPCGHAR